MVPFSTASAQQIELVGACTAKVVIRDVLFAVKFLMFASCSQNLILAWYFLSRHHAVSNCARVAIDNGFVVMHKSLYQEKASEAIHQVFDTHTDVSLEKVRTAAKKLCNSFNIEGLVRSIEKTRKVDLDIFFTVKTLEVDCPFRGIISKNETWQKCIAFFLQNV